jgi:hypothetical protein
MGSDLFSCWAFGGSGGLVVPGGVEGEVSEDFSGGGVDDFDVEAGRSSFGRRRSRGRPAIGSGLR